MHNIESAILIASSSSDEHAYDPVRGILERKGYPVILYRTDKVLQGEDNLRVEVAEGGDLTFTYNGFNMLSEELRAGWYRKIAHFTIPDAKQNVAKQLYVSSEVRHLHDTIWSLLPEDTWLNPPDKMAQADRKLGQLLVAQELGFSIPHTVVGSNWEAIDAALFTDTNHQVVIKMLRGIIAEGNELKALYSTVVDKNQVHQLQDYTVPFPGIYQPFITKAKEWRVTVVGEDVFAAAIYTGDSAKDDWRRHQLTDAVQFKSEALPDEASAKCIQYLGSMGLRYGAFDFIETLEGELVFLECNPNGQYGWLEEGLGFPISNSIAAELIKIAKT